MYRYIRFILMYHRSSLIIIIKLIFHLLLNQLHSQKIIDHRTSSHVPMTAGIYIAKDHLFAFILDVVQVSEPDRSLNQ
jgi:hypothetical protein